MLNIELPANHGQAFALEYQRGPGFYSCPIRPLVKANTGIFIVDDFGNLTDMLDMRVVQWAFDVVERTAHCHYHS